VQKKFRGSSLVNLSYTWSHALTDMQTDRSTAPQNTYCSRCEYGPAQIDRRHVLTANWVYDLPFFVSQQGFIGHVLGGWEYSGIASAASGLPLTVTGGSSIDPAGQGVKLAASVSGYRPDLTGDPNAGAPHTFNQWFNTAAFADVPAGQFRPGNERRGAVTGPGYYKFDMSLFKNIKFTESTSLQFRAEAFNVFNHTNFQGVNTSFVPGSTVFGKVNSTRDPRIMQLALKFYF